MNLLEVGKIVRVHGIKGAVKVIAYIDEFKSLKHVYITSKRANANIKSIQSLNNDAYVVTFDIMPDIDTAERFKNELIYIDRDEYAEFKDKLYLSDLLGKPVKDESGEVLGELADFNDYGASVILTIRTGSNSYDIPYVDEIITFDRELDSFVIARKTFEDLRV